MTQPIGEELLQLKDQLDKLLSDSPINTEECTNILKKLATFTPSAEVLKETGMGKYIHSLTKNKEEIIRKQSKGVFSKWKSGCLAEIKQSLPPTPAPSPPQPKEQLVSVPPKTTPSPIPSASPPTLDVDADDDLSPEARQKRDTTIQKLTKKLASESTESEDILRSIATRIERALFNSLKERGSIAADDIPGHAIYRTSSAQLVMNLASMPELVHQLTSGTLLPERFALMTSEELASPEQRALREKVRQEFINKSITGTEISAESDQFECPRCHQRRASYYQKQTRSADEPMTTFVHCLACGKRWRE